MLIGKPTTKAPHTHRASTSRYPLLYQVNTRVWLTELSRTLGRRAVLDDIPDSELDRLAQMGFRLGLDLERVADRPVGVCAQARID